MNHYKFRALLTPFVEDDEGNKTHLYLYVDEVTVDCDGYVCFASDDLYNASLNSDLDCDLHRHLFEKVDSDNLSTHRDEFLIKENYCCPEQALQCDKNGELIYENDVIADDRNMYTVKWSDEKNRFILVDVKSGKEKGAKNIQKYELVRNSLEDYKWREATWKIIEKEVAEIKAITKSIKSQMPTIKSTQLNAIKEIIYANNFKPINSETAYELSIQLSNKVKDWSLVGEVTFEKFDTERTIRILFCDKLLATMTFNRIDIQSDNFNVVPDKKGEK